jgi:hypothetical protein
MQLQKALTAFACFILIGSKAHLVPSQGGLIG